MDNIAACPDVNLSAKVTDKKSFSGPGYTGTSWRIGFEIRKGEWVYYRMAMIRRGSVVAQTTFTPAGDHDIGRATFVDLASRAGTRLVYAD